MPEESGGSVADRQHTAHEPGHADAFRRGPGRLWRHRETAPSTPTRTALGRILRRRANTETSVEFDALTESGARHTETPTTASLPDGVAEAPENPLPASDDSSAARTDEVPAAIAAGHDTDELEATGTGADDSRYSLRRATAAGGGVVLPPDWRTRVRPRPKRPRAALRVPSERLRSLRALPATVSRNRPSRDELRALLARRPSAADIGAMLRRYRALIGAVVLTLVLTAGDGTFGTLVTDRPPGPAERLRVAVAHPLQVQVTPPSARRYLDAIDTGERLREQAVVAAAARATLERAKAEAAAAAAGQAQPWINSAPAPGTLPPGILPPGAIPPGSGGVVLPAFGMFTSGFGQRWGTFHRGIDIAGPIGTPIYAVAAGTVIDAGPAAGFGLWVRIRHDDGTISVYGHMYDFFVSVGERVPAGMQIARMGNRGDSTGPHLHFEIIVNGGHVDPQRWLALHGLGYG